MGQLFFKLYDAGLSNCRMSLDIGVGLAYLTGRTLTPYGVKPPWTSRPLLRRNHDYTERATVFHLFDLPVPVESIYSRKRNIRLAQVKRPWSGSVVDSVFVMNGNAHPDDEAFPSFVNRRSHIWTLNEEVADEDLLVDESTLGLYSHFFYGDSSSQSRLRAVIHRIRPRRPYRDLAKRIADSLAPFNTVHIRRGDFQYAGLTPRAHRVTGREITENLATRLSRNDRLVICTDESSNQEWFAPIRRHFRDIIFLDQLLLNDWRSEFFALPFHDDAVVALVTQLVAARAQCFVGTLFSTFSALIQRARGMSGRQSQFLYCYSDWHPKFVPYRHCEFLPVQDGLYSWNRILYPVCPGVHSWFREWPESFDSVSVDDSRITPDGTLVLRPSDASICGTTARYERSYLLDNIGWWTDSNDYVTWSFSIAFEQAYSVEIRYACPGHCAGSIFALEFDGEYLLSGKVSATWDWTVFSSWCKVGSIDLCAGDHVVAARILHMQGHAAMNLAGVRLVPAD